ncbi:serine-threonine-isoleucine rich protein, putative [Entamoeba histolytica]
MIIINILILFICSCMSKDCLINSSDFTVKSDCNNVSFDNTLTTGEIKVNLEENNENTNIDSFTIGSCTKLTLTGKRTIKKLKLSNSCPLIIETEIKVEEVDTTETNNGILYYAKHENSIPQTLSKKKCDYYRAYKNGHSESEKCDCTRTHNKYSEIDCDSITDYSKMNLVDDCFSSMLTINQNWKTVQPTKNCTVTLQKNISSINLKQQKDVVVTVKEDEDTKQENAVIKAGLRKQNSDSQKSMTVEMDSSVTVSFIKVTGVSGTCDSNSVCVYTTQSDENLNNGGVSSNKCGTYYRIGTDKTCTCTLKDKEKTIKKLNFKESDCQDFTDLTEYTLTLTPGQKYTLGESLSFKSLTESSSTIEITGQTKENPELKEAKENPELKLKTMKIGDLNPTDMKLTVTDSVTYEDENKNKLKTSASRTSNKLKATSDNKKTFTATSSTISFPGVSVSSSRYIILQKNSKITVTDITGSCENTEPDYCDFIASDSLDSITIGNKQRTESPKEAVLSTEKGQVVRVMKTGETTMNKTVLCSIDKNDDNSFDGQFTAVECPCSLNKDDVNPISTTDNTRAECVYVVSSSINTVTLKGRNDLKEKLIVDSTSNTVSIKDVTKISNIQDNIKDVTKISNSQDNSNTISLTGVDKLQSIYIGGSVNKLTSNLPLITTSSFKAYSVNNNISTCFELTLKEFEYGNKDRLITVTNENTNEKPVEITIETMKVKSTLLSIINNGNKYSLKLTVSKLESSLSQDIPALLLDGLNNHITFTGNNQQQILSCDGKMLFTSKLSDEESKITCLLYHDYYSVCTDKEDECNSKKLPTKIISTNSNTESTKLTLKYEHELIECKTSDCYIELNTDSSVTSESINYTIKSTYNGGSTIHLTGQTKNLILNVDKVKIVNKAKDESNKDKTLTVYGNCNGIDTDTPLILNSMTISGDIKAKSLTTSGNLTVTGNSITITESTTFGTGKISGNNVDFTTGTLSFVSGNEFIFKSFKVTTTTTTDNNNKIPEHFLNYNKECTFTDSKVIPVNSYLTQSTDDNKQPTYKCYTITDKNIELNKQTSYLNPESHKCTDGNTLIQIESPNVIASGMKKFDIGVDTYISGLSGVISIESTSDHSISVFGDSTTEITINGHGKTETVTVYSQSIISGFNNVIIATSSHVTIKSTTTSVSASVNNVNIDIKECSPKLTTSLNDEVIFNLDNSNTFTVDTTKNIVVKSHSKITNIPKDCISKCNDTVIFSKKEKGNDYVCQPITFETTYSDNKLELNPCTTSDIPCSGIIYINDKTKTTSIDLTKVHAQKLKIINSLSTSVSITLPTGLNDLTLNGLFTVTKIPLDLTIEDGNVIGTITQSSDVSTPSINVENGTFTINTKQDITLTSINAKDGSVIFKNTDTNTIRTITIYGSISVNEMTIMKTKFECTSTVTSISINKLNVQDSKTYQNVNNSIFNIHSSFTGITISNIPTTCVYVCNLRNVIGTLSNVEIEGATQETNIFYKGCSGSLIPKIEQCEITKSTSIDVSDSQTYTLPSLCPNNNLPLVLTTNSDDKINVQGFDGVYKEVKMSNDCSISFTGSTQLNRMVMKKNIEIHSDFQIDEIITSETSNNIIIGSKDVYVGTINTDKSKSNIKIEIKENSKISIENDVVISSLILDDISSRIITKDKLTTSSIQFKSISPSTLPLIISDTLTFTTMNITNTNSITTNVPLIQLNHSINGNTNLPSNVYFACQGTMYVYIAESSYYTCPLPYTCTDTTNCQHQTGKKWKQQYIYSISKDGELTFEDNSEATNGYDIIEISKGDANINIKGGSYYIRSDSKNNTVTCSNECTIYIETTSIDNVVNLVITESNIRVKDSQKETYINVLDKSNGKMEVHLDGIYNTQFHLKGKAGNIKLLGINVFNELILEGSIIKSDNSFDIDKVTYKSGTFELSSPNNIASISQFNYESNHEPSETCTSLISHQQDQINNGEISFKIRSITNSNEKVKLIECGGIVLQECKTDTTTYNCPPIRCSYKQENKLPTGCYCTYSLISKQECIFDCENENECTFNDPVSNSLIEKITNYGERIVMQSVSSVYSMNINETIIESKFPINIYEITDGEDKRMRITGVTLNVDSITMSKGTLSLETDNSFTRRIEVTGGQIEVNNKITFSESNKPLVEVEGNEEVKERGIFITGGIIKIGEKGKIIMKGGIKEDGYVNNINIKNAIIEIEGNRSDEDIIVIENGGDVNIENITVNIVGENKGDKCFNLIRNNDIERITLIGSSGVVLDSQRYILSACPKGVEANVQELACSNIENKENITTEVEWERKTCPCSGDKCIIDFSATTSVIYKLPSNEKYEGLKISEDQIRGEDVKISRVEVSGTSTLTMSNCSISRMNIKGDKMKEVVMTLKSNNNEKSYIEEIVGNGTYSSVVIDTGELTIGRIEGVNVEVTSNGYLNINKEANFKEQKIDIEHTYIDILTDDVDFTDAIITIKPINNNSANLNIGDEIGGKTMTTIKKSVINVYYEETGSKTLLVVMRLPKENEIKVEEYQINKISNSRSRKEEGDSYQFKVACHGIVLTNLEDKDIVCPEDRLAGYVKNTEFPKWTIGVMVIFVIALIVIVVVIIVYAVYVYLERRRNLKVFSEGEEVEESKEESKEEEKINN